jgi:hypothetical protein
VKPSYHDVRVPLVEKAKKSVDKIKKSHELAWTEFGCTLMSDGWTDRRDRHLINFLVNSPAGTFFLEFVNASSETADAQMLAALLEKRIDVIDRDKVVRIVTDNGANFKAVGRLLERKIPHYLDPCLRTLGKLESSRNAFPMLARRQPSYIGMASFLMP